MGLRSSSLAKKNDGSLTWVLHKRDDTRREFDQNPHETGNTSNVVRKSLTSSTSSEYREGQYDNHAQQTRRNHVRSNILDYGKPEQTYGYGITDLDDFLSKASIGRPGNIPMVLCTGCLLYQTQLDDHYQTEVALPLGMVVNAVFKNEQWLYVQTPHAEEGYIPYGSCLPLGVTPPPPDAASAPCWETQSDVFPAPIGDRRRRQHHRPHRRVHQHTSGRRHVHRGRPSGARSSADSGGSGACDDDDYHNGGGGVAIAPMSRRRRCSPDTTTLRSSATTGDGGAGQWLWTGGRTGPGAVTGYGYL